MNWLNRNKKNKRWLFVFMSMLFLWGWNSASAQYDLQVNTQVFQPVTPYLPQLAGDVMGKNYDQLEQDITDKLSIQLINTSAKQLPVKLTGSITRLSPGYMSISLSESYQPRQPILMQPNQMISLNRNLIEEAFGHFRRSDLIFDNTSIGELRANATNYKLPEGMYRVCIAAYDYNQPGFNAPLSAPGTGCATFQICYSASAPQIIQPVATMGAFDGEFHVFTALTPQIQFSWTPPVSTCGLPLGLISYDLEIRELFEGQEIQSALFNPPVFLEEDLHNTTYLLDTLRYPNVLQSGKRYIMLVKAKAQSMPGAPFDVEIENQGYSEIAGFVFNPPKTKPLGGGMSVASKKDTSQKQETIVKGMLTYRFGDDLESELFPLANQKVYIKRVYAKTRKDADGITHYDPLSKSEQNGLPAFPEMLDGRLTETDADGRFELKVGMTAMDEPGLLDDDQWNNLFAGAEGNNNPQPARGRISIRGNSINDLEGRLVQLYKIEVANPHFKLSEEYIQISPGRERNLHRVIIAANSYTLKVNVKEVIEAQKGAILTRDVERMEGAFAKGATVKLYRLTKNKTNKSLAIPYFEGDLLTTSDWKEEGDKVLIASRTTPDVEIDTGNPEDYSVSFPRLFRNAGGETYDYVVCLEDGKGALKLPINTNRIIDPIVPLNSGIWAELENLRTGDPNIMNRGNGILPGGMLPAGNQPQVPGINAPGAPAGGNIPDPKGLPGHGPNAGDFFPVNFPLEESAPQPAPKDSVTNSTTLEYEDKWQAWNYNGNPDTAYLTLEKELAEPPHSVVSGKLEYKFKGDPSIPAQPYANMPVKLMVFYLMKDGSDQLPVTSDNTGYYQSIVQEYANQDLPEGYGHARQNPSDQYKQNTSIYEDNGKVLETVYTDAEGRFTFDFENLDSTMQIVSGGIYQEFGHDDRGRLQSEIIEGDFMRVYRIVPDVNQYTAPDENVEVQPWGNFDCGTLTTFVRTFNLEVAVQTESSLLERNDIPVQLYYNPNANPAFLIPTKPGVDLNKPMEVNGQNYILLRQDLASENKEETFQNALSEGALAALETGMGYKASVIPDKTYRFKTTTFHDLVISQSAADYSRFYYIEAGGFPMERQGNITMEADYLTYPENQISDNWDSDFYNYRSQGGMDDFLTRETRELEKKILFSSEFDPDRTIRVYLAPKLAAPRIAGRLIDEFTTLGIKAWEGSVKLEVKQEVYGHYTNYTTGQPVEIVSETPREINKTYRIGTDDYGYFDFSDFTKDFKDGYIVSMEPVRMIIDVPGYNKDTVAMPQVMNQGEQIYMDPIVVSPKCVGCYGFVSDEDDHETGVAARVKVLQNGRWVDTYPVSEGTSSPSLFSNSILSQGIQEKTIIRATQDVMGGNPGFIDTDFRPALGLIGKKKPSVPKKNSALFAQYQSQEMLPGHGPNAPLPPAYFPPGDEWRTFGGIEVKTNDKGEVKEARIVEGMEGKAGMWQSYVDAVNVANGLQPIRSAAQQAGTLSGNTKQRFDLPMPLLNTGTKIVILPYDRSYMADTVEVNSYTADNLGTFYLKRRKHKIKVMLNMKDFNGNNQVPVGAIVSIDGVGEEQVVDSYGAAYFEFVNNATSDFTLRVRPQRPKSVQDGLSDQLNMPNLNFDAGARNDLDIDDPETEMPNVVFVPKTVNFSNEDDNVEHLMEIEVEEGGSLSGKVTFEKDGVPVKNAVVYLDRGQGLQTDVITTTDDEGRYVLAGIPIVDVNTPGGSEIRMGASYSDKIHSYIGEVKNVDVAQNPTSVDFQIREIDDMDLTHIFGMPVRLVKAERNKQNGYKITGEFIDLPANPNFSIEKRTAGTALSFNEISVVPSDVVNANGIPLAVPVEDKVKLDNKELSLKAYEVFNAKVTAQQNNGQLSVEKVDSDTSGSLRGAVRIVDNSFNFPSSYMTISDADFFLGNFGETGQSTQQATTDKPILNQEKRRGQILHLLPGNMPQVSSKLIIPVFSSQEYPLTKFSLTNVRAEGITFNYLGFDGVTGFAGARESYIHGDSVNLYLDLTARIQGGIELNFNAGKAVLTHNSMKSISNEDTLNMQLEQWEVMSTSWELSPTSGGIVLKEGVLNTGVVGLPFTDMAIIPGEPEGELICNSLDATTLKEAAKQGKLVLGGGAAELGLYDDLDIVFVYDPDVGTTPGEGHYKFSLHSRLGKVAYFGGLDGMTDASQRLEVQFVSSLSNGEQLFAFDGEAEPITLYNQIKFVPQRLFNYNDNFSIGGLMSMNVPDLPKNIGLTLRYDYVGEERIKNKLVMSPIDFHFMGNGSSRFKIDMNYEEMQRIDKEVIALPGVVTLPQSDKTFNANFVSIVYEGAKDLIPANGKANLAYHRNFPESQYVYAASNKGGVQSVPLPGLSQFLQDYDETGEMKTHTEIFVGTSDQLFGDAAKALTGSMSAMNNYGSGAGGAMSDFSNDVYNQASGMVNDMNTHGRQAYNNLLNRVGSLRLEAHKAYEKVASHIEELRTNGRESYEQVYGEILTQLDDLKTYSDDLYDGVLSKRNEFLNYGNEVYDEIYSDITGQVDGAQNKAEEMYEGLTSDITEKINEFQSQAAGIYSEISNKANELRAMGDEMYDQLYQDLSGTFDDLRNKGNEVARDVNGIINDYKNYGTQLYTDAAGNIEDIVNTGKEVLDQMMNEADELRRQADDAYNKVEAQINALRAQGQEAYAAAQEEILTHLDELRSQGDALYNELQSKRDEWMQQGQNVIDGAAGQIADLEAYGREMYDGLYQDISGRAEELQAYAANLYNGIAGPVNDLRSMGQDIYDEVYGEISGTIDEYKAYGEDIYNDMEGLINEYRDFGREIYDDIYNSVSGKVDEIRDFAEGLAGDAIQYGEDIFNEALAGPLGDVVNEMNELRNTAEQYISMGTQKVDSIMAKWPLAGDIVEAFNDFDGNDIEGSLLRMAGNMVDFKGIKENAKDKLMMVANEGLNGIKESLEIDNISESVSDIASNDVFKAMNIDIDLSTGRITGSMYTDYISFGAVDLYQLGIEVLIDTEGWYLYSGAGIDMPTSKPLNPIIFPIGVGFLVGMYPTISPSLESRVTQHSYVHQLPNAIMQDGIMGFFLTGKKDILKPTSVAINFAIVDFEIGASAGLDARLFANFGDKSTSVGLGVMAFAEAHARLSVLGTCGISGSAAANVGIKASYTNSAAGSSLSAAACASVTVSGSAWCGWGAAKISGDFSESIMAMLGLCAGNACSEAVTMKLELGGSCATSNDFDYAN